MRFFLLMIILFLMSFFPAQSQPEYSSANIFEQIKKLDVLGSVLYIAAHPDDENTQLLSYLSKEKHYRTGYLSVTRGEGGQNLIGDNLGIELGLIRTQELLSARKIDGAQQFFTTAFDFGYSKNPEETFRKWDKEKILGDMVWVIRKFRPDVIITRFPTTGEGGHGHHTASAILAEEAFLAAADASRFPEQLKYGVKPWRTKRLLWNTFNFGSVNTIQPNQFKVDVGGYNPILGKSYGEISAQSRSQHKSQGFGVPSSRGAWFEYFKLIAGDTMATDLMDGVNTSWSRISLPKIENQIQTIRNEFSFLYPEKSVNKLLALYQSLKSLPEGFWQNEKLEEVKEIIKNCSGLYLDANVNNPFGIVGDSIKMNLSVNMRLPITVRLAKINSGLQNWEINELLSNNKNWFKDIALFISEATSISQPYWLVHSMNAGSYNVMDQRLIGQSENLPISIEVTLEVNKMPLTYKIPIRYKTNDPVKGEEFQPLFIIPRIEVKPDEELALVMNNQPVKLGAQSFFHQSTVPLDALQYRRSKEVMESSNGFYFRKENHQTGKIDWYINESGQDFNSYKTVIQYPHIPHVIYFQKAQTKLVGMDLKIAGTKIGYIVGAGDKVPEALTKMGYQVTLLSQEDVTPDNLKNYDAIITGVRAYNIHEWLNEDYETLMDYVKSGGVLLVQYNTNNNIGPVKAKIGPYPFVISRERVTEEDAPVIFSDPQNILLNFPNKITSADFENWIQERSIYHAIDSAGQYKTLFDIHDTGEKDISESLIYADFGKGRFIYTGISFFRELPAGVSGAFRLLANLLTKPILQKNKKDEHQ